MCMLRIYCKCICSYALRYKDAHVYLDTKKELNVIFFRQADEEHTTVKLLLKFNGDKSSGLEKLRESIKYGDIAGISVDPSSFRIEGKLKVKLALTSLTVNKRLSNCTVYLSCLFMQCLDYH